LFSLARKLSPVIIFLDEAESLLGSRSQRSLRGGYLETINQFLREWDGLTNSLNNAKTFVMVATNRPYDLDEAVLRRLPRRILVDLPIRHARLAILQSLLREETLDSSISLSKLASRTELYSGSDLKNLCVAAAMEAVKEQLRAEKEHGPSDPLKKRILTAAHFQRALNDITASISQDMESLKAIRKFDEQYGDGRRQRKQGLMGFEVVTRPPSSEEARIRKM
jgi:SpoVK/Ycf46/Vps4 family AAA+-type ATPase